LLSVLLVLLPLRSAVVGCCSVVLAALLSLLPWLLCCA